MKKPREIEIHTFTNGFARSVFSNNFIVVCWNIVACVHNFVSLWNNYEFDFGEVRMGCEHMDRGLESTPHRRYKHASQIDIGDV